MVMVVVVVMMMMMMMMMIIIIRRRRRRSILLDNKVRPCEKIKQSDIYVSHTHTHTHTHTAYTTTIIVIKWVIYLLHIQVVSHSNLCQKTGYIAEVCCSIPQSCLANARIIPQGKS